MKTFPWVIAAVLLAGSAIAASRQAVFAQRGWYPAGARELQRDVDKYILGGAGTTPPGTVRAVIAPHAGYRFSGTVAGHSYKALKGRRDVERVIILAPCHRYPALSGASILDVSNYVTPLGSVPLDSEACAVLRESKFISMVPEAHADEHSLEIQLPFIQRALADGFKVIPVVVGGADKKTLDGIAAALEPYVDETTVIVASSDFVHYGERFGFTPFTDDLKTNIQKIDMDAIKFIMSKDAEGFLEYKMKTKATICGSLPIYIMLKLLADDADGRLLKYDTSGRMTRDFNGSVSYVAAAFFEKGSSGAQVAPVGTLEEESFLTSKEEDVLLRISRDVLDAFVRTGEKPYIDAEKYGLTDSMKKERGVFVTLKKNGSLRGCIGYVRGVMPIYEAVADVTVKSCSTDRRFAKVNASELDSITISISVMSDLMPVKPKDVVVGRDGLLLQKGRASGLLLPQVPVEQGWSRAEYLDGVSRKAGLPPGAWNDAQLLRFTAQVFSEKGT